LSHDSRTRLTTSSTTGLFTKIYLIYFQNIKKEADEHFYGDVASGKRPRDAYFLASSVKKRKSAELKGEWKRPSDLPWTIRASFKCRVRADVVWGKERLKEHYNIRHKTALKEHEDMVHARMFCCSFCKLKVVHDTFEIAVHLAIHDMNVEEYAEAFERHLPKSNTDKIPFNAKEFPCSTKRIYISAELPSSTKEFLCLSVCVCV
jgi:hypothetical protein